MKKVFCTNRENEKGFSILEVLIASSIFSLIVVSLLGSFTYIRQMQNYFGNRNRAILIANEGLEVVRNLRDSDFNSLNDGIFGLSFSPSSWFFSGSEDYVDDFKREITISSVDSDTKEIRSKVSWGGDIFDNSVELSTYLTNWRYYEESISLCDLYCQDNGYSGGICRENSNRCRVEGESYSVEGSQYCIAGPQADSCCCAS